jgi:CHASE3 domain sensor protein
MKVSRQSLSVDFGLVVLLILSLQIGSYFSTSQLISNADRVAHTQEVLRRLNLLQANILEVESNARGYALTGEESFLQHNSTAVSSVEQNRNIVRELTADNIYQQQQLDSIEPILREKLLVMQRIVDLRRSGTDGSILELIRTSELLRDKISAQLEEMKEEERRLLTERTANVEGSARQSQLLVLVGTAFSCIGLLVVFYLLNRNARYHKSVKLEQEKVIQELEARLEALESSR